MDFNFSLGSLDYSREARNRFIKRRREMRKFQERTQKAKTIQPNAIIAEGQLAGTPVVIIQGHVHIYVP